MIRKKILIVDDDQDLVRGLAVRLKANNYDPVFATDAVTAISVANKEKPDLILLDIGLPAGDGFIVMDRLKKIISLMAIPVIILSARDPLLNKERAFKAGAKAFFLKPAENEQLLVAIQEALK